eukprot:scaffold2522_cov242-Pinguiococcus_pyrenoidosus.AAC.2
MSSFDDPRDVADHEAVPVVSRFVTARAEGKVWGDGGEGVVGNFGLRVAHAAEEGGLSGVWEAQEADIAHKLELDLEPASPPIARHDLVRRCLGVCVEAAQIQDDLLTVPFRSKLTHARSRVSRGFESLVAAASLTAQRDNQPLAMPRQLTREFAAVLRMLPHEGSGRHGDDNILIRTTAA